MSWPVEAPEPLGYDVAAELLVGGPSAGNRSRAAATTCSASSAWLIQLIECAPYLAATREWVAAAG